MEVQVDRLAHLVRAWMRRPKQRYAGDKAAQAMRVLVPIVREFQHQRDLAMVTDHISAMADSLIVRSAAITACTKASILSTTLNDMDAQSRLGPRVGLHASGPRRRSLDQLDG